LLAFGVSHDHNNKERKRNELPASQWLDKKKENAGRAGLERQDGTIESKLSFVAKRNAVAV
jgi:hypothetical protein